MPTKEEILKVRTAPFENMQKFNHNHIHALRVSVLFGMEEYAKQEALAYSYWERNHSWECDYREERSLSHDEYWEAYQKSKSN